jgi:hypothetical protein
VVKAAFGVRGGEVEVLPAVSSDALPAAAFDVVVRAPGGGERRARATAVTSHVRGPMAPLAMLRLAGVGEEDVPAGAEIFVDVDEAGPP